MATGPGGALFIPGISIRLIQQLVADQFKVPVEHMTGLSRKREHSRPRQVAMSLAIEFTGKSKSLIGRRFGGRDHSTVWHAEHSVERVAAQDADLRRDRAELRAMLGYLKPPEV